MINLKPLTVKRFKTQTTERQPLTAVWRNGGGRSSYEHFC